MNQIISPEELIKGKPAIDVEGAVRARYSAASQQVESALCCPVQYNADYLRALPREILERDYGCGDPSRHVREGETVLDLGSGGGKICYIASQVVGPAGKVIGVDVNDDMLALARRYQEEVGDRIGWRNVEFRKGKIQDLALDLEHFSQWLAAHPVQNENDWLQANQQAAELRASRPLIAGGSIDVVVSNCVLNLVSPDDRRQLFNELFRVLKPGGRAVISDITSDRPVPRHLQADPRLWSGCISGAFQETEFLAAFAEAGFIGLEILERQSQPWTTVEEIEFRSVTVRAYKPALPAVSVGVVMYPGPWKTVTADSGLTLHRGRPTEVSAADLAELTSGSLQEQVLPITTAGTASSPCCEPGSCC